ncbi:MAG: type II CAAX endopeptidase family protein [Bryobacterales bacterium]|nr:CPBP family intramembrane metalloprotease [Bryobacteraceae bacterium]MDW8128965.1 type II CAAX endopeptidase family protein [Bryobacterales bacterium]
MATLVAVVFIVLMLALLSPRRQAALRRCFGSRPAAVFLVPLLLAAFFSLVLFLQGALVPAFLPLLAAWLLAPTAAIYSGRHAGRRLSGRDLAAVLLLWLPVEFALGKPLLPTHAHSIANETAQGTALAMGLLVFVIFRNWPGHKYNLPRRGRDFLYALVAFAAIALPLAALGRSLGFLGPLRLPLEADPVAFLRLLLITLLGVAIPEELLFRSLIQNWLVQRFRDPLRGLLAAALVFGAAHLNNGPGPLPNWRYMLLATIAGFVYGLVFQRSTSVLASAFLHALVNSVRHTLFR